jgi:hypothetical protein
MSDASSNASQKLSSRDDGPAIIRLRSFAIPCQFKRCKKSGIFQLLGQGIEAVLSGKSLQVHQHVKYPFVLHNKAPLWVLTKD